MTATTAPARLVWAPPSGVPQEKLDALIGPGAPFEMQEEDVLGVRMPVFVRRQRSLWDLLKSASERFPDRPYVVFPDSRCTFREILGPVAAAARVLRDKYGVGRGDRVAIAPPTAPSTPSPSGRRRASARSRWRSTVGGPGRRWPRPRADPTPGAARGPGRRTRAPRGGGEHEMAVVRFEEDCRRARVSRRRRPPCDGPAIGGRGRPVRHPVHQRHDGSTQGRGALAPQQHPFHPVVAARGGGQERDAGPAATPGRPTSRPRASRSSSRPRRCSMSAGSTASW